MHGIIYKLVLNGGFSRIILGIKKAALMPLYLIYPNHLEVVWV